MRDLAAVSAAVFAGIGLAAFSPPEKQPRSVDLSQKSVADLTSCIVLKLTEVRGYEVARSTVGAGAEIRLKYRVMGVAATAATFLIEDQGEQRRLTIYATGKSNGAPRVIANRARECIS